MKRSAKISKCGRYRYYLIRSWNINKPVVVWVMLNPSTADGLVDDPTIRKCFGFSNRLGYGRMVVVNLFAYRATNPRELLKVEDPYGPRNEYWQLRCVEKSPKIIIAWGTNGVIRNAGDDFMKRFLWVANGKVSCFSFTKNGQPRHPLMLSYSEVLYDL